MGKVWIQNDANVVANVPDVAAFVVDVAFSVDVINALTDVDCDVGVVIAYVDDVVVDVVDIVATVVVAFVTVVYVVAFVANGSVAFAANANAI